jgi:hypothetical protein
LPSGKKWIFATMRFSIAVRGAWAPVDLTPSTSSAFPTPTNSGMI